jgi:hypothetical protein
MKRRILRVSLVLAVVLLGLRAWLHSSHVSGKVADRLSALLGAPVQFTSVGIALAGDSTFDGLNVRDVDPGTDSLPWLSVDQGTADISALGLLFGRSPDDVNLDRAQIKLQFAKDGSLLTRLPSPGQVGTMPRLHLTDALLTLDQEGRSPLTLRGIKGDVVGTEDGIKLTGAIHEPDWGEWDLEINYRSSDTQVSIKLTGADIELTRGRLESLPFVSRRVWKQVQADGTTSAEVRVEFRLDEAGVRYRVDLGVKSAHLVVPSIELDATRANGRVIVEDRVVQLRQLRGRTADGEIVTTGDLDFRGEPYRLQFDVTVKDVLLQDLPRSWKVPEKVAGALSGQATVEVTIGDEVTTSGKGTGFIEKARVGEFTYPKPIPLKMHADGARFHFTPQMSLNTITNFLPVPLGLFQGKPASAMPAPPKPEPVPVIQEKEEKPAEATPTCEPTSNTQTSAHQPEDPVKPEAPAKDDVPFPGVSGFTGAPPEPPKPVPGQVALDAAAGLHRATATVTQGAGGLLDEAVGFFHRLGREPAPDKPQNYLEANLSLEDVNLSELVRQLNLQLPFSVSGRLSFHLTVSIPLETPGNLRTYRLEGTVALAQGNIDGFELAMARAHVHYTDGVLNLDNFRGRVPLPDTTGKAPSYAPVAIAGSAYALAVPAGRFDGTARLEVEPLRDIQASLQVDGVPLDWLLKRLPGATGRAAGILSGKVEFRAPVQKLDDPASWTGRADLRADKAVVYGVPIDRATATVKIEAGTLRLTDLRAGFARGELSGSFALPLRAAQAGDVALTFKDVDLQPLMQAIPGFPLRLEGQLSGDVTGALPAPAPGMDREANLKVDLSSPRLRIQGVAIQRLQGTINYRGGKADYRVEGETLGGRMLLEGKYPAPPRPPAAQPSSPSTEGTLRLDRIGAGRLLTELGLDGTVPLRGSLALELAYRLEGPDYQPQGRGVLRLRDLRLRDQPSPWTDDLRADVRLTPTELRFSDFGGNLAAGTLTGQLSINLRNRERSWYHLTLDNADAGLLLGPLISSLTTSTEGPIRAEEVGATGPIQGALGIHLHGNLARESFGSGRMVLTRGKIFGVEVTEWRLPIEYSWAGGSGQVSTRDTTARLAVGRAQGQASLRLGGMRQLEGAVQFYDIEVHSLLRSFGDVGGYVAGRVSGRLDLRSQDFRTLDDLTANLQARLMQTQAFSIPVLREIGLLAFSGRSGLTFDEGQLRAQLTRGVIHIQSLTLSGQLAKMVLEGTVRLTGALDLEATVQTRNTLLGSGALAILAQQVPLIGPIPVGVLVEATSYFSGQVLHYRVTGTLRSPVVRLEPLRLLTEEAVRFLLNRTVPYLP